MTFVDSSAWIALTKSDDTNHVKAVKWWKEQEMEKLVTSNLIVMETLGWVRNKKGKKTAIELGKRLLDQRELKLVRVLQNDEPVAWKYFQDLNGRGVSMVDCTSIAVMKRLGIKTIFTFDGDFEQAGFE